MSLVRINQQSADGQLQIEPFTRLSCLSVVQAQSKGPGTLRFAKTRKDLEQQPGAPVLGGLTVAPFENLKEFFWIGDLWVTATANDTDAEIIVHPVLAENGNG